MCTNPAVILLYDLASSQANCSQGLNSYRRLDKEVKSNIKNRDLFYSYGNEEKNADKIQQSVVFFTETSVKAIDDKLKFECRNHHSDIQNWSWAANDNQVSSTSLYH